MRIKRKGDIGSPYLRPREWLKVGIGELLRKIEITREDSISYI